MTATRVAKTKEPGRYADGNGLWLQVKPSGSRSWLFRYMRNGKARHMGLGPLRDVSLADARAKAADCRKVLLDDRDPLDERRAARTEAQLADARAMTFRQCAEAYMAAHEATWKNAKHRQQWRSTLATYAHTKFGNLPVAGIDTALVMAVLEPIWTAKPETASRLRGRIEVILNWAKARGYRKGENPAAWRGHLDQLLPARSKVRKVKHHAALPYSEIPTFMEDLRERLGMGARALEFAILTATRTGEVIGTTWDEIDSDVWTIPADRMKGGREHRVPLSQRTLEMLGEMPRESDMVFPGARAGAGLSNMALLATLRRMDRGDLTAHGFRSTFRDWAAECTAYPNEVSEMALAHVVKDKTEAAYRRGDLFEKRKRLMRDWGAYCSAPAKPGKVIPIRSTK
ncbi:MAG: integrase arm-type DNA-binding domain-containing protein [Proteobacteria bacterium]|nr:integrase arm-type DNA-binding domain-containing protein [Pseudomonadota bacterium]